jgi:hypothetical protein
VILLSSTQGKTNNTTHFIHLWPLPSQGFRHLLAVVNLCKSQPEALLGLTLHHMSLLWTHRLGLQFASQLGCISGSHFHTLSHSTVLLLCSLKLRGTVSPQKVVTRVSHWELIRLLYCFLRQAWIWTWVLTSLRNRAPRLIPKPSQVPLCDWNSPPWFTGREAPSPQINPWMIPGRCSPPGRPEH